MCAGSQGSDEAPEEVGGITRGVGETFGVASLLLGAPTRNYGMWCAERTLLLHVPFHKFVPFLAQYKPLERSLLGSTKRFLLQRYSAMHTSIFHSFTADEVGRLAAKASFKRVAKDEVVYASGDQSHTFYVVCHGEVVRDYGEDSEEPPRMLGLGAYFGEVGLLLQRTPMLATVHARVNTTLITVAKEDFVAIVQHNMRLRLDLCIKIQPVQQIQLEVLLLVRCRRARVLRSEHASPSRPVPCPLCPLHPTLTPRSTRP